MLGIGKRVKVQYTPDLYRWGVNDLVGKTGTIVDIDNIHRNNSYLVLMDDIFQDEREWFFPQEACVELNNEP